MLSGHLREKNNTYYAVLNCKHSDGKRYSKWVSTGIAVKKGNTELLDKINTALESLKDNGTLDEIVAKYIKAE